MSDTPFLDLPALVNVHLATNRVILLQRLERNYGVVTGIQNGVSEKEGRDLLSQAVSFTVITFCQFRHEYCTTREAVR